MKMKVIEKDVQASCLEYLALKKYFYFRLNNIPVSVQGKFRAQSVHTPKGLPDCIVLTHGKFIGLEFKGSEEKLSSDQAECALQVIKHGGMFHIVRSIDDLKKIGL